MTVQYALFASATLVTLASYSIPSLAEENILPAIVVTATPFQTGEDAQILVPAKILSGYDLRNKLGTSLGDTLSREPGMSASAFGAGASRPVIRGLEGPRIKILQNGMTVADLSSISSDHAVATEASSARQIEILRGPAALLYGSGAIGGLINVVNDRIPTMLFPKATGEAEVRLNSVDQGKNLSFSVDGAEGSTGLHVDGHARSTSDYKIPGFSILNDTTSPSGKLPNTFTRSESFAMGASHIGNWGHIGASIDNREDRYGIPTSEKSFIDLNQTRIDIEGLVKSPLPSSALDSAKFKIGSTHYRHTEKEEDGTPAAHFRNKAFETRWEFMHQPLAGWRGTLGLQTERATFSALSATTGRPDTIPITTSSSTAAFLVEERDWGKFRTSAGLRLESIKRRPDTNDLPDRTFDLASYSIGGGWTLASNYQAGVTFSSAQRAPTTEELYSYGPHEATATFDVGDTALHKETSRNIELSLQKIHGPLRWKTSLFYNRMKNFIYGRSDGATVDDAGNIDPTGPFRQRFWAQAAATVHGAELEVSYNARGEGLSWRVFADTARGALDNEGNLPLQPATRFGIDLGYQSGPWRSNASLLHALKQDRLATFESHITPSYTQMDAGISYTRPLGTHQISWFAIVKNLFNQDIRLSTSILQDRAPQPGRSLTIGIRTRF